MNVLDPLPLVVLRIAHGQSDLIAMHAPSDMAMVTVPW
ncbi:hypothetical protein RAN3_1897 [plant metagenome]|uniref:Uncharacterized protein n=1 Tax=plant metagenome TaxID=1297885 RepID=A0A484V7Z0_9ZZZZ